MGTAERRERDLESREAALLAAAAALLEREDWASVTVEAIAAEAEYAKGTVYKHFASKDEIYARLALARTAELCQALEGIDAARPFEQVLLDFVRIWWRHLVAAPRLGELARGDGFRAGLPSPTRTAMAAAEARLGALLAGLIELGVDEGALPEAPTPPRLFAVQALIEGAARLAPPGLEGAEAATAAAVLALLRAPADAVPEPA